MPNLWKELGEKVKVLGANWASVAALGSFALYLVGYLSLRFHLTALGVGTDLAVLDERYLFTGAKFLVYLVSSIPNLILLFLIISAFIYLPYRLLPEKMRESLAVSGNKLRNWIFDPLRLALIGVIFSLIMIQFFMRQCFFYNNLLLAKDLPANPVWLRNLLLSEDDSLMSLYFSGLIGGVIISVLLFLALRKQQIQNTFTKFLKGLFLFLISVQILMIPVNFGVLVVDKSMPRVRDISKTRTLQDEEQAWLIWEGKEGATFLVLRKKEGKDFKTLVTFPRSEIGKIEISTYDSILQVLFSDKRLLQRQDSLKEER
jgi:hypothetical protein